MTALPDSALGASMAVKRLCCVCSAIGLLVTAASADPTPTIRGARDEACVARHQASFQIERTEALNDVARELSRGGRLKDAIDRIGYSAGRVESLYLSGPTDDASIREIVVDRTCRTGDDPRFNEVGVYRSGSETWVVFGARVEQPPVAESAAIGARVLALVNGARAEPRRCGRVRFPAAPPLALSTLLSEAASRQAQDMALQGSLDHRGSDGSQPAERVSRAGYRWRATGENIAAGQSSADAAVSAWLGSPEHCANIMSPRFTEMGVAFALSAREPAIYWAQVFGAPL